MLYIYRSSSKTGDVPPTRGAPEKDEINDRNRERKGRREGGLAVPAGPAGEVVTLHVLFFWLSFLD